MDQCHGGRLVRLTGVIKVFDSVVVEVTVFVAVGVRKQVHALLIFAVSARPVSLQPYIRLLGTL
jgi:hypothetical protein